MSRDRRSFVVERCLGRGGFGEVYLATMRSPGGLSTQVALKVLRADLGLNDDAVRRLRDEGRMLARVRHPSILRVVDLVSLEGRVCLVTDYVEGQDLRDCMGQVPARVLLEAVARVASALDAAWNGRGDAGTPLHLVHRDIKPSNLRLGRHGEVVLLDFGIARTDNLEREARTRSDLIVGSLPYMAPERFFADGVSAAADVFGLAAVLYEGLTGVRFHRHTSIRDLARLASKRERFERHHALALGELGPEVGPELRALLHESLAFSAEDRPTAAALSRRTDEIAQARTGPHLAAWCRDRAWPAPAPLPGPLEGRTLTEGEPAPAADGGAPALHDAATTTADAAMRPAEPPPAPPVEHSTAELAPRPALYTPPAAAPGRPWLALAAAAALGVGLVGVLGLGLASGLGAWLLLPEEETEAVAPQVPLPAPPVREAPATVAAEAAVELPTPAPDPALVRVSLRGGAGGVELRMDSRRYHLPAEAPEGTYEVWADLGGGMALATTLVLDGTEGEVVVSCSELTCSVSR